ncbi:FmdB family zinc ribbon protein [Actinospongicola halichondriae]|uniref:FmdB family zinc ribbon protein n=1 Tax=Actinospongicola halichondriae TaxID=3236844 RepID=UPI003D3F2D35
MPTYEYRCKDCGHDFEVVQAFTDDALTKCPECKGKLKKVYGNVGISFKGSGFYKNDARSSSGGGAKSSTSSSSTTDTSSSSSDSSTTTEKKSETKSDTKKADTKKSSSSNSSSSD